MLFLLLLACAYAHVPVFNPEDVVDVQEKSFGIYKDMKKGDKMTVKFGAKEGQDLVWSVHVMGSVWVKGETPLEVSLFGHNTSDIRCKKHSVFRELGAGHSHESEDEKDHKGVDEMRHWNTSWEVDYEGWGVGLYQTLASCKFTVPVDEDRYLLTVRAKKDLPISVGIGEAERFDFVDYMEMPYRLLETWSIDGYPAWALFLSLLFASLLVWLPKRAMGYSVWTEKGLLQILLLFSASMFASRLIQVQNQCSECDLEGIDLTLWLHIFAPLLIAILLEPLYPSTSRLGEGWEILLLNFPRLLILVYAFFFVWMTFRLEWILYFLLLCLVCRV